MGVIQTATYGAVAMTAVPGTSSRVFYLVNPLAGANTLFVGWGGACRPAAAAIDFTGVDQTSPIRTAAVDTTADSSMAVTLSCLVQDMCVGYFERDNGDACGNYSSQSPLTSPYSCCVTGPTSLSLASGCSVSYGLAVSSPQTLTCLVTDAGRGGDTWVGVALAPYVPPYGRGTRYYFNIWDPRATVKDRNERPVPPNELRADNWIELQGVALPNPNVYSTYVEDPTKAYIVEVSASQGGAQLRASRNQFADTLIKRAAAGRG
jgi:hypothetical protein